MEHVSVRGIGQKRSTLNAVGEVFFNEGNVAQLGDDPANVQAPMRVQVVDDPIDFTETAVAFHGIVLRDMLDVSREVLAGAGEAEIVDNLAGRHIE